MSMRSLGRLAQVNVSFSYAHTFTHMNERSCNAPSQRSLGRFAQVNVLPISMYKFYSKQRHPKQLLEKLTGSW